jgi:hypothetical protein
VKHEVFHRCPVLQIGTTGIQEEEEEEEVVVVLGQIVIVVVTKIKHKYCNTVKSQSGWPLFLPRFELEPISNSSQNPPGKFLVLISVRG